MFDLSTEQLEKLGATITVGEVNQQPELWQEVIDTYQEKESEIKAYLNDIQEKHDFVRVIFSGAGTSAFVGETIAPYLNRVHEGKRWKFEAIGTTDIVSSPTEFLEPETPTLLVSFARSGNSPESVSTIELAQKIVKDLYQVTITCAAEGKLAIASEGDEKNLLLLQPERSNDQGFAMTGSYTCMTLTALLVFDTLEKDQKVSTTAQLIEMAQEVVGRADEIQTIVDKDFNRIVYLGSDSLYGVAHEAGLKILELTAGKVTTLHETPLGFRHGPKSYVDDKTLVVTFVSNDDYTRLYDNDLINEVHHDKIAQHVISLDVDNKDGHDADQFTYAKGDRRIADAYLALPYIVYAQTLAVMTAIKVDNKPDTPSPTGTVNRVVQGVIIHDYK